jgi:triosephosphate isomerase
MKKPLIAGNWKMFKTVDEAASLAQTLKAGAGSLNDALVVVCPPFTAISAVSQILCESSIEVGAQNMYHEAEGAFTGEISPLMLKDLKCRYVILGHSERRQHFKETDKLINTKVITALKYSLIPILCIGETLEEREANQHFNIVQKQLVEGLKGIDIDDASKLVIAYEPVWAIGTGKTASPAQAEEMHSAIRKFLIATYDEETASKIPLLYGGSVKPDNTAELMSKPNVDGALVGGAALKAEIFLQIIENAIETTKSEVEK